LIQEGNLELLRAVRTFDFTMDFRFSTLATACIRSDIIRGLADQARLIRLPANVAHQLQQVRSAQRAAAMAGTACSDQYLSQLTGIPVGKVECLLAADQPVSSLDSEVPDGRGGTESLAKQLSDSSTADAADPLAVPRERIRQIEGTAMAKLKDPSRANLLQQFQFDGESPPGGEPASAPAALSPAAPATAATPPAPLHRVPASRTP
jgi:DNA-directed RNA polymerase sigma subunit (sigma70/sigma32)